MLFWLQKRFYSKTNFFQEKFGKFSIKSLKHKVIDVIWIIHQSTRNRREKFEDKIDPKYQLKVFQLYLTLMLEGSYINLPKLDRIRQIPGYKN